MIEGLTLTYHFDSSLRDVPDSPQDMALACDLLAGRLEQADLTPDGRVKLLGTLGTYLRMLDRLDEATTYLQRAVELAEELGSKRAALVNRIRLAHVYQWQRGFVESDRLLEECLAACERDEALCGHLDFACQHLGKSKFDQGKYAEAISLFERALALRQAKGDAELTASTELALEVAQKRVAEG